MGRAGTSWAILAAQARCQARGTRSRDSRRGVPRPCGRRPLPAPRRPSAARCSRTRNAWCAVGASSQSAALGTGRRVAGHAAHLIGERPRLHLGVRPVVGGLNLSPRQSATMAAELADYARVYLTAPPAASTLPCRRPEQGVRRKHGGETLGGDLFVPKQLGWGRCLGTICLSPAATIHRRPRLSAAVRPRCHAV